MAISRIHRFGGNGTSRDKPASAYGRHDGLQIGKGFKHFQGNGPLARDHLFIVIGMDQYKASFGCQLPCERSGLVKIFPLKDHLGMKSPCVFHLEVGRMAGHDDDGRNTQSLRMKSHCLGMIPGRHGDDSCLFFFR